MEFRDLENDDQHLSKTILRYLERKHGIERIRKADIRVNLVMYYSPNDLNVAFNFNFLKMFYMNSPNSVGKPHLSRRRNIRGRFSTYHKFHYGQPMDTRITYNIVDLYGWNSKGLAALANSLGVSLPDKDFSQKYGARMLEGLLEQPKTFLEYSKRDATALLDILSEKVKYMNTICREYLGIDLEFTTTTIPYTIGALVKTLIETWIPSKAKDGKALSLALRKIGLINPHLPQKKKKQIQILHNELFYCADPLQKYLKSPGKYKPLFEELSYPFLAYSNCSVVNFLTESYKTSAHVAALIYGGRCNNEKPYQYIANNAVDIDIAAAYGNSLEQIEFPLGTPTIYTKTHNEKPTTLGEFLAQHKDEHIPGMYTINVSGNLSFPQDFLYSRDISEEALSKIGKRLGKKGSAVIETSKEFGVSSRDDSPHIHSDMILSRRQLQHAVVTSYDLEIIEKMSTSREYREFMELTVDVAVYYSKKDRFDDADTWADYVLKHPGKLHYSHEHQSPIDERTRAWVGLPFSDFIGKLKAKRLELKAEMKREKDPEKKHILNALQEMQKLIVNTSYGCIASPYFRINNTVLANNITARCRMAMWMLAKALSILQSITDGGIMSVNDVHYILPGKKKPGIAVHSDIRKLVEHKSIRRGTLADRDWSPYFEEPVDLNNFHEIDDLVYEHIQNYIGNYGLKFPFPKIEHKPEHVALTVSYIRKADNVMRVTDENGMFTQTVSKMRGFPQDGENPLAQDVLKRGVFGNKNPKLLTTTYTVVRPSTIPDFVLAHTRQEVAEGNTKFKPGQTIVVEKTVKLNNTHYPVDSVPEYEGKQARARNKDSITFTPIVVKEGYRVANKAMELDNVRYSEQNINENQQTKPTKSKKAQDIKHKKAKDTKKSNQDTLSREFKG